MRFATTIDAAEFINETHKRFAGKRTRPRMTNPNTFNALMRIRDYIKGEPAAISVDVEAVMDYGCEPFDTIIRVIPIEDDGWEFVERPASSNPT